MYNLFLQDSPKALETIEKKPILSKPMWSPCGRRLLDGVLTLVNPTTKTFNPKILHFLLSLRCCEKCCRFMASWPWFHHFVSEGDPLRFQWLALWVELTLVTTKLNPLVASSVVSGFALTAVLVEFIDREEIRFHRGLGYWL